MTTASLLIIDDDEDVRRYLTALLPPRGYEVHCVESGEKALAYLAGGRSPSIVLLDLLLPGGMSGLEALDRLKRAHPAVPVIVLSTVAQIRTVVDAIRRGAADYLTKPFQEQELQLALRNVLEKQELREEVTILRRKLDSNDGSADFVSTNPAILRIKEIGRQVANTDAPVLMLGESGVGKEVVARFIHGQSRRRNQPFIKVNCAALPQELLESELFGYERGAFSGALREKPGRFELADRGSILLDEIGEMSPSLQAKLLHVLQDGEFIRLGGRRPMKVDARVLASTNSRLGEAVAAGRFRQDLYFRLNVIRIDIPALRDRRDDIPLLCAHFLRLYAVRYNSTIRELPRELRDAFLRHEWPGNVRELENAVRRYVILPDVDIALANLEESRAMPTRVLAPPTAAKPDRSIRQRENGVSLRKVAAEAAEEAERRLLRRVLDETRWNRREAALQLKISYKALLNKLKKWEAEEELQQGASPPKVEAATLN